LLNEHGFTIPQDIGEKELTEKLAELTAENKGAAYGYAVVTPDNGVYLDTVSLTKAKAKEKGVGEEGLLGLQRWRRREREGYQVKRVIVTVTNRKGLPAVKLSEEQL